MDVKRDHVMPVTRHPPHTLKFFFLQLPGCYCVLPLFGSFFPSVSNQLDRTMQHFIAAAASLTRFHQLPWLALMMRAAATSPIFGLQSMRNRRVPHERLGFKRPFLSALELSMWLRDSSTGTRRTFERRAQRLRLLCIVQFCVVSSRLCFAEQNFYMCVAVIRRCVSARGVWRLLDGDC